MVSGTVKKVKKSIVKCKRVSKNTLRAALLSDLKTASGRKDIKFGVATKTASKSQGSIPIEQRAGFPVTLTKGGVHPKDWKTHSGCKIFVDFSRAHWLPDTWGQGVKITTANGRSTGTGGGTLTCFVAPDGKSYFHKHTSEEYYGKGELTAKDGWNGQVRLAKVQAQQSIQLARAEGDNGGLSSDSSLFKLLTPAERKCLPSKDELHVCIVSARRATKLEGVRDIFMVQSQFVEAGVCPTWYVDAESLGDYKALGLKAVVGGKLTPARNKALADARKLRKVCVQVSDDITAWEYRDGPVAKVRTDDACNAAHHAAKRLIITPVAAARFIIAKMRGSENPKPMLGGVYMLGSCSRTFAGDAFARNHFILGDFFVVEPDSTVKFDEEMTLKEDYDFSCSHIAKYGSVMRCQRMTLAVKHYSNSGGACSNRDAKGTAEERNIAILHRKWPGRFRKNPKRKNEVIMSWKKPAVGKDSDEQDDDDYDDDNGVAKSGSAKKRAVVPLKKSNMKKPSTNLVGLSPSAVLLRTKKESKASYITERCKKLAGKTIQQVLAVASFQDDSGKHRTYSERDLRYDLQRGFLTLKHGSKK